MDIKLINESSIKDFVGQFLETKEKPMLCVICNASTLNKAFFQPEISFFKHLQIYFKNKSLVYLYAFCNNCFDSKTFLKDAEARIFDIVSRETIKNNAN